MIPHDYRASRRADLPATRTPDVNNQPGVTAGAVGRRLLPDSTLLRPGCALASAPVPETESSPGPETAVRQGWTCQV